MRRIIFFLLLLGIVGFSVYVVLFNESFWRFIITGEENGYHPYIPEGYRGWETLKAVLRGNTDWNFDADTIFLKYSLLLFLGLLAIQVVLMLLTFFLNRCRLSNSRRFYRMVSVFATASLLLTLAYIGRAVYAIHFENFPPGLFGADWSTSWSLHTFPVWFYVPIVSAILLTFIASIFRVGDRNNGM